MASDVCECKCEKKKAKKFGKIRMFFLKLFHSHKSNKKYEDWLDREVRLAIENEKRGTTEEGDDIFLEYSICCIKCAAEVARQFSKQGHSGMSASITLGLIRKLCNHEPITKLMGTDDEWGTGVSWDNGSDYESLQNNRDSRVFKKIYKDGKVLYSYNEILNIINIDDVWLNYPPVGDSGTLDDDDELVKHFFKEKNELKNKLNSEIKFPYKPITHYYKWNFETKQFEKI